MTACLAGGLLRSARNIRIWVCLREGRRSSLIQFYPFARVLPEKKHLLSIDLQVDRCALPDFSGERGASHPEGVFPAGDKEANLIAHVLDEFHFPANIEWLF